MSKNKKPSPPPAKAAAVKNEHPETPQDAESPDPSKEGRAPDDSPLEPREVPAMLIRFSRPLNVEQVQALSNFLEAEYGTTVLQSLILDATDEPAAPQAVAQGAAKLATFAKLLELETQLDPEKVGLLDAAEQHLLLASLAALKTYHELKAQAEPA